MPKRNGNNAYEKNLESSSADSLLNQSFDLTEDEAEDFPAELNGEKPASIPKSAPLMSWTGPAQTL